MLRRVDHSRIKVEVFRKRANLMRENLDLRRKLAEIKLIIAQHYDARLREKDDEIARLMAINRAERDRNAKLDMYLQLWVLNNPEVKDEAQSKN